MGICLGFQSLCYEFGNDASRLQKVKHGQVYDIYPVSKSELFPDDESPFEVLDIIHCMLRILMMRSSLGLLL